MLKRFVNWYKHPHRINPVFIGTKFLAHYAYVLPIALFIIYIGIVASAFMCIEDLSIISITLLVLNSVSFLYNIRQIPNIMTARRYLKKLKEGKRWIKQQNKQKKI